MFVQIFIFNYRDLRIMNGTYRWDKDHRKRNRFARMLSITHNLCSQWGNYPIFDILLQFKLFGSTRSTHSFLMSSTINSKCEGTCIPK